MSQAANDIPGIIAPPPVLYLAALALGGWLQYRESWPISALAAIPWLGLALAGLGGGLAAWSFLTMRGAGTTPNPYKPSSALSVQGPYRLTRNPIYLAMTLMYLGIALMFNAACVLLMLGPLLALMHWGVILREERYLAQRFGTAYASYQARVRRWI